MADLVKLKDANVRRWKATNLTRGPEFLPVAKRLVAAKERYLIASKKGRHSVAVHRGVAQSGTRHPRRASPIK